MRWAVRVMARARGVAHRRPEEAWRVMAGIVAFISLWQGFGYVVGGNSFTASPGWQPLLTFERSLHVHGLIMTVLGFALAVQIGGALTPALVWTLRALRTYSLVVAFCWFGSWVHTGILWGAPGWWLLLAALTIWLTWFAPSMIRPTHAHQ